MTMSRFVSNCREVIDIPRMIGNGEPSSYRVINSPRPRRWQFLPIHTPCKTYIRYLLAYKFGLVTAFRRIFVIFSLK